MFAKHRCLDAKLFTLETFISLLQVVILTKRICLANVYIFGNLCVSVQNQQSREPARA